MFYDLNLNEHFEDYDELGGVDCSGFCIAQKSEDAPGPPTSRVPLYSRIDIQYSSRLDSNAISRLRRAHSLVCISIASMACMPTIIKLQPDIVRFPVEELPRVKKALAGMLGTGGIYVEVCVRDALYGRRVMWMNGLRRLLRLGCGRFLVMSSGATTFTELKGAAEMMRILALFDVKEATARRILDNSARLLRLAALKRYSADGAIAHSVDDGRFKRDFVIHYKRTGP